MDIQIKIIAMDPRIRRTISVFVTGIGIMMVLVMALRDMENFTPIAANDNTAPILSVQREQHILYGDSRGGGHLHGEGKPCKSEFPANWSADEVIDTVKTLAANDNIDWRRSPENGYFTGEQTVDGVRVRVVLDREQDEIVTAYPLNTKRNPCDRF